jgi:hypothetical protein
MPNTKPNTKIEDERAVANLVLNALNLVLDDEPDELDPDLKVNDIVFDNVDGCSEVDVTLGKLTILQCASFVIKMIDGSSYEIIAKKIEKA